MYQGIYDLHVALDSLGVKHVYYESPGTGHEWLTWRRSLHQFAPDALPVEKENQPFRLVSFFSTARIISPVPAPPPA
jgi:hypothetical protein